MLNYIMDAINNDNFTFQTRNDRESHIDDIISKLRSKYEFIGRPTMGTLRDIARDYGITEIYNNTTVAIGFDGGVVANSKTTGNKYIITPRFRSRGLTEWITSHELGHVALNHPNSVERPSPEFEREANYFATKMTGISPMRVVIQAFPEFFLWMFYDVPKSLLFNKNELEAFKSL